MSAFRLATVARLRQQRLDDAADALRRANAGVAQAQAHLDDVHEQLRESARPPAHASGDDLQQAGFHREVLREEAERAQSLLDAARADAERSRDDWMTARAELRAVEALAARHRLAAAEAARRREQALLDDLASSRSGALAERGGAR
ncbi:MAG: flagellar export protein FliJ [Kineosporiaceae bacterium]